MTADTTVAQQSAEFNPFDSDNAIHGGGLWDNKTVTITGAVAKVEALTRKDGSAVLDEKTKQQVYQTGLVITGIAEGGDDKERRETYSVGDRLAPTPDGEGFVPKDGHVPKDGKLFHANSNMSKFNAALKAIGFPIETLIERTPQGVKQRLSRLVGARFVFKGEAKTGRDGKPIKDAKGYDKQVFLPVKFVGYVAGQAPSATRPGNGAATPAGGNTALIEKAVAAVTGQVAAAGGKITRAQLITALARSFAADAATQRPADPEGNAVLTLVVNDKFFEKHTNLKYDGKEVSL